MGGFLYGLIFYRCYSMNNSLQQQLEAALARRDRGILSAAIHAWRRRKRGTISDFAKAIAERLGDEPRRVVSSACKWQNQTRFPSGIRRKAVLAELSDVLFNTPASPPAVSDAPEIDERRSSSS